MTDRDAPRVAPHALLRVDPKSGRSLVVLPERAVELSGSGREILDLCDGERSCEEVLRCMTERHPDEPAVESDVRAFLAEMERLGVLTARPEGPRA